MVRSSDELKAAGGERYEARIARAIDLIDARIGEQLDLAALASAACLSPFHFHRVFGALVGESVHDFTTRRRLEHALALARRCPEASWTSIAERCGYRSLSVFSRAFKRQYGVSPRAFGLERWWVSRPDAEAARSASRHFLRPAPALPAGFRAELIHRPAAELIGARARGAYLDPSALLAAYARLVSWAAGRGLSIGDGRLAGASQDDPEITPLARCRYDFVLEVEAGEKLAAGLFARRRPPGWWVAHRVEGDLSAVDAAWNLLFKSWLPASGLNLRDQPAEEVYRRTPEELGWDRFDLLCCIPVEINQEDDAP